MLIIGGGPVGVELAAEIAEELPGKEARTHGPLSPLHGAANALVHMHGCTVCLRSLCALGAVTHQERHSRGSGTVCCFTDCLRHKCRHWCDRRKCGNIGDSPKFTYLVHYIRSVATIQHGRCRLEITVESLMHGIACRPRNPSVYATLHKNRKGPDREAWDLTTRGQPKQVH